MHLKIQDCDPASVFTPTEERLPNSYLSKTDLIQGFQILQSEKASNWEGVEDFFKNFLIVVAK